MKETLIDVSLIQNRLAWLEASSRILTRVGLYLGAYETYIRCREQRGSTIPDEAEDDFWTSLSRVTGSDKETSSGGGRETTSENESGLLRAS
jgi:hypothetical protein